MPKTIRYYFWQWLLKLSKEKLRTCVIADWKCPHCNRWTSEIDAEKIEDWGEYQTTMICGGCYHVSVWDTGRFPVPVLLTKVLKRK